ncbi:recombination directionality factor [Acinetobacter pollinis]|uniref:recombination directionality factor n=1 Tax=Acinetobacter pollinis TaxID=2605270 RepID=UPI0018A2805E|nr:hydrolase or metal-binding protein [Acinetobacter pollinis]MBF7689807.1 hydrolase or metal-binding protein [Acinetobacter pollinis]MBF7697341.1 hydrolase or metal-binding protein [Acinetobacter pollinis]
MMKGLLITPPVLGRISIGRVVEKNGKRQPEKDDQFTITSQIQNKEGWVKHPLDDKLRVNNGDAKLRQIPVRMIFNDPELNLRAEYNLFDRQTGRPICVGNGEVCHRMTQQGVEKQVCPTPHLCPMGQNGACKPYGRLYVNLDESDELGTFVFRTTGFNSIRTLAARLAYYQAASKDRLSCLPLQLVLRGKSTTQSYRTPIYYVDLTLPEGVSLQDAIQQAKELDQKAKESGFDQSQLDAVAKLGYQAVCFDLEEAEEEVIDESEDAQSLKEQKMDVMDLQHGLKSSVQSVS